MLLDEKGFFDCNNATLRMFGFLKPEDFTKVHPSDVSPPYQPEGTDSLTAANNKIEEAFRKGMNRFEWMHRRKNGEDFPAEVLLTAFQLNGKQVLQATVRDITERKKIEEALKLARDEAERASMAKTNFLQTMSHELRTPLNAVLGFSEILKQKTSGELNEKQEHFLDNIITGGNNLLNIISQILEVVKMDEGTLELHIEKIPVPETVDEVIGTILEKAVKKNVLIEKKLDPELEYIEADKQKFRQVFINLLDNAVKFSKDGGGTVTVAAKKEGEMARFSVSDTGIGIREDDVGKLFQKFTQLENGTTRKYQGTGIGLAISKQFVELHRGRIWAESKSGEGSTFTFILPVDTKKIDRK
jgi:PAS domain S-box-containing protein